MERTDMAVEWIITDIDGCLSPEESIPWDLDLFGRFARICRDASTGRGKVAPMTLCTGRPQPYVEVLAKILDIRAPMICENGAVFYSLHDNRSVYGPGVTPEKIQGMRAVRLFIESAILPKYPEAVYQFGKEAQMSVYSENTAIFPAIQRAIEEYAAENSLPPLEISPSHYYLNISMTGVNKGVALRQLMQGLGVTREETAGIGDTEGDLPLRDAVGFFACPANAKSALKARADYVSPYPNLAGVLDILEKPEFQRKT